VTVLGVAVAFSGDPPIRLLFVAGLVGGLATPVGLVLLILVAGDDELMRGQPVGRCLRAAGWAVTGLVSVVSLVFIGQQVVS
jgi:Mn2+/Fe2+ NRAMP family transporter